MFSIGANLRNRDRSACGGRISGTLDRGDEGRDGRLLGIVDDLRARLREDHLDGGHTGHCPKSLVDMLHAAVAGHACNRQGGDHDGTLA